MRPPAAVPFTAYASGLSRLVVMACFLPIVVVGATNLIFHPQAPAWARTMGAIVVLPILVYYAVALRLYTLHGPVIDIDERGLLWQRWSNTRIPWSAIAGWKVKSTLGQQFVTVWLRDGSAYPSTTINGWLAIGNRWLGYGDLTLATAGTDGRFEDLVYAISVHTQTRQC